MHKETIMFSRSLRLQALTLSLAGLLTLALLGALDTLATQPAADLQMAAAKTPASAATARAPKA